MTLCIRAFIISLVGLRKQRPPLWTTIMSSIWGKNYSCKMLMRQDYETKRPKNYLFAKHECYLIKTLIIYWKWLFFTCERIVIFLEILIKFEQMVEFSKKISQKGKFIQRNFYFIYSRNLLKNCFTWKQMLEHYQKFDEFSVILVENWLLNQLEINFRSKKCFNLIIVKRFVTNRRISYRCQLDIWCDALLNPFS